MTAPEVPTLKKIISEVTLLFKEQYWYGSEGYFKINVPATKFFDTEEKIYVTKNTDYLSGGNCGHCGGVFGREAVDILNRRFGYEKVAWMK